MNSVPMLWLACISVVLACVTHQPTGLAQCEVAELLASDGADADEFGQSVCIDGDAAIVGANRSQGRRVHAGAAYIFEKVNEVWTQTAKLVASDGEVDDLFGWSVSMSGHTAIVGAIFDDGGRGSAYIFEKVGGVWTQQAKLLASDGAVDDWFGASVSLSGDAALVGAYRDDDLGTDSGSAYIFERVGGAWSQRAKLLASDGAAGDGFGRSVSISNDTAIVGALSHDHLGDNSGSAYVYKSVDGAWVEQTELLASDGQSSDQFGVSVSISERDAIVGARAGSGSAYVFESVGGVWAEQGEIVALDGQVGDNFGSCLSISGDVAVVGAPYDRDRGFDSGSAYVFVRTSGVWTQQSKLLASDGEAFDAFGTSVFISGRIVVVGAEFGNNGLGLDSGSAYVFDLGCGPQLSVAATCPSGGPIEISWSGARPNGQIALIFAANTGSFRVPNGNPCAGTPLGLGTTQIQLAFQGGAGSNGARTLNATAGPNACGGYLQLLDISSCGTSNVARIE